MDDLNETVQRVLESNKAELKAATSDQQIEAVAKDVARQVVNDYNPGNDRWAYMSVILILGIVLVVVSYTYASYALTPGVVDSKGVVVPKLAELPDALIALGSAAIGALAGLLAPTPRK